MKTRLEREMAARQSGKDADAAFTRACSKLGLRIKPTLAAPIALITLAQTELDVDLEQRRTRRETAA